MDAESLTRAFVTSRGRTGSSAIVQELGSTPYTLSLQEIFTAAEAPWALNQWAPLDARANLSGAARADAFLQMHEEDAVASGRHAIFFKVLSNHFAEQPYLQQLLKARGYRVLYLKRAASRQVISGMVARQRGRWNSQDPAYSDTGRYVIDLKEYRNLVLWEAQSAIREAQRLRDDGFDVLEIDYEDYLADRQGFYARIFGHLGLPQTTPEPSTFQIMIDDPRARIANYDEVAAVAAELGAPL